MKDNRFKLTAALVLLAAGCMLAVLGQHSRGDWPETNIDLASDSGQEVDLDITLLLTRLERRLQQEDPLAARLKWRIHAPEFQVAGAGEYLQIGTGTRQRHGLSLTSSDPLFPFTLQQAVLSEPRTLWTEWTSPLDQSALSVHLNDVTGGDVPPTTPVTGMANLVWRIRQSYHWRPARSIEQSAGSLIVLEGQRKEPIAPHQFSGFLFGAPGILLALDGESGLPIQIQWQHGQGSHRVPVVTVELMYLDDEPEQNHQLLTPVPAVSGNADSTRQYRESLRQAVELGKINTLTLRR